MAIITLAIGIIMVVAVVVGVAYLLAPNSMKLEGSSTSQLEHKRNSLYRWIRRNEIFMEQTKKKDDPNWLRLQAAIEVKKREYDELNKMITARKVEEAEKDALE
jgi:hypothetical protein